MRTKMMCCGAVLLLLALAANPVSAQVEIGLIGGTNHSTYHADTHGAEHTREFGLAIGGVLDLPVTPAIGLHAGAMFIQKGGSAAEAALREDVTFSASMLEVPLFFTLATGETTRPYLTGGPTVGIMLSSDLEGSDSGFSFKGDLTDVTKRIEVGLGIGGGVSHRFSRVKGFVEGRYVWGLTNLMKDGDVELTMPDGSFATLITVDKEENKYRYSGLQVLLGFTVPLGGEDR